MKVFGVRTGPHAPEDPELPKAEVLPKDRLRAKARVSETAVRVIPRAGRSGNPKVMIVPAVRVAMKADPKAVSKRGRSAVKDHVSGIAVRMIPNVVRSESLKAMIVRAVRAAMKADLKAAASAKNHSAVRNLETVKGAAHARIEKNHPTTASLSARPEEDGVHQEPTARVKNVRRL